MKFMKVAALAASAFALVATPVAASAAEASAQKLSLSNNARVGASMKKSNKAAGGLLIPFVVVAGGLGIAGLAGAFKSKSK